MHCDLASIMLAFTRIFQVILRIAGAEALVAGSWPWIHYDLASVMFACTRIVQVTLRIAGAEVFVAASWAWIHCMILRRSCSLVQDFSR
jgi:hypothetical protein